MKKQELINKILEHEPEMYEAWFKATRDLRMCAGDFFESVISHTTYREFIQQLNPEIQELGLTENHEIRQYQEEFTINYLKKAAKQKYDEYVNDFIHHINTNLDPQTITVYRNIRILKKDYNLFKNNLKNNIFLYGYNGIGKYWTINPNQAKNDYMPLNPAFIGLDTITVMLIAKIENYNIINTHDTFLANISLDYFEEEEITLDIGSKVNIKQINDEIVDLYIDV